MLCVVQHAWGTLQQNQLAELGLRTACCIDAAIAIGNRLVWYEPRAVAMCASATMAVPHVSQASLVFVVGTHHGNWLEALFVLGVTCNSVAKHVASRAVLCAQVNPVQAFAKWFAVQHSGTQVLCVCDARSGTLECCTIVAVKERFLLWACAQHTAIARVAFCDSMWVLSQHL